MIGGYSSQDGFYNSALSDAVQLLSRADTHLKPAPWSMNETRAGHAAVKLSSLAVVAGGRGAEGCVGRRPSRPRRARADPARHLGVPCDRHTVGRSAIGYTACEREAVRLREWLSAFGTSYAVVVALNGARAADLVAADH